MINFNIHCFLSKLNTILVIIILLLMQKKRRSDSVVLHQRGHCTHWNNTLLVKQCWINKRVLIFCLISYSLYLLMTQSNLLKQIIIIEKYKCCIYKQQIRVKSTLHATSHHHRNQKLGQNCKNHGIKTTQIPWIFKQLFQYKKIYTNNGLQQQQTLQQSIKSSTFC